MLAATGQPWAPGAYTSSSHLQRSLRGQYGGRKLGHGAWCWQMACASLVPFRGRGEGWAGGPARNPQFPCPAGSRAELTQPVLPQPPGSWPTVTLSVSPVLAVDEPGGGGVTRGRQAPRKHHACGSRWFPVLEMHVPSSTLYSKLVHSGASKL